MLSELPASMIIFALADSDIDSEYSLPSPYPFCWRWLPLPHNLTTAKLSPLRRFRTPAMFPTWTYPTSFPGSRLHNVHSSIFRWSILHSPSSIRPSEHWDSNEQNAPLLRIQNSYWISSSVEPFLISFAASSAGLARSASRRSPWRRPCASPPLL